jgi:hypothetical protein
MAYLICVKNLDNVCGSLYRIAENKSDLDNINIRVDDYKIIEISQNDFDSVKLENKFFNYYNGNSVDYTTASNPFFKKIQHVQSYVNQSIAIIDQFLNNNINHSYYSKWNSYKTQLLTIDVNNYPLDKSIPKYFSDLGQNSLNTLQIP